MHIDFDKLPPNARIWVYQANRVLTQDETGFVEQFLKPATNNWAAHGSPLLASAKVFYNRFVVVGLDQSLNQASGCSIDASTHWLKDLGEKLAIDFFDRSLAYVENETIKTFPVLQAKKAIYEGLILPETIVFNTNALNTKADLEEKWQLKANELLLLKRFFNETLA